MTLRIPLGGDQTLQTEFHEIERRLRRLEKSAGVTTSQTIIRNVGGATDLSTVYARIEALEQQVGALQSESGNEAPELGPVGPNAQAGIAPDPGTASPPTGVAQHLLTEDAEWGFPLRGLIGVSTSGEQTEPPNDVVHLLAGLHCGHIMAADLEGYNLRTHGDVEWCDTFYDDLRIEPVARTTGSNAPTFEKWADNAGLGTGGATRGVYLYSFDDATAGSEKEVFFSMQMPHAWKLGTPILMHVHWIGAVSDTTAAPRWGLEYFWKDIGQTFGATETIIYSTGENIDASGTADPDVTAGKHYISEFGPLTPGTSADGLSSILVARLFRNSSDALDTYNAAGAKCGLLYIDAHYETDSPGSSNEYVK